MTPMRNVGGDLDRLLAQPVIRTNPRALEFVQGLPRRQSSEEIRTNSAVLVAMLEAAR